MTPEVSRRALLLGSAGVAGGTALVGCSAPETSTEDLPVRIHANDATTFQPSFNPYAAGSLQGPHGLIYETLQLSSPMDAENPVPWLATEVAWNEDGTVLTVHLRDDVRWTDGEVLDAEDVVFTYEMIRDNPATNGLALAVAGATALDATTVEISFSTPTFVQQADVCSRPIVPEHVFSTFDPGAEQIAEPMGSGPYRLERFSDQLYTFVRNDEHWAAEEFEPRRLAFPSFTTQTMNTALQAGELDWSGGFISNIDKVFVGHDPEHRGYWYPGAGVVNLTLNLERELWQDLDLRRAISLAVDRLEIAEVAYMNYFGPPHPTGLPRPTFEEYIAEEFQDLEFAVDLDEANRLLDAAGYEAGEDGIRVAPDGTPLSFPLQIPSTYNDWVTVAQILGTQLRRIGVELTPRGISFENWVEAHRSGNYDVTITTAAAGQNPWYLYRALLSSEYRSDDGEPVTANFQRWYDEESDELLSEYSTTEDPEVQREALAGLQHLMVERLPVLPIVIAPNWFNYNTADWTGFPSAEDPYALGSPVEAGSRVMILHRLTRTGS
ncbi:ABC transporter substrate-binding protein [Brachybacterium sp. YJGR34]|uniref:ABC transporter substrate-binding protein n=1 Tax=Brachybacterium sp. YJGR34 TaxID=2059911 RepID=UPI000E0B6DB4|nr:ABC transporter substrate-binding protein [Brachybacterium sp. YJGR34]